MARALPYFASAEAALFAFDRALDFDDESAALDVLVATADSPLGREVHSEALCAVACSPTSAARQLLPLLLSWPRSRVDPSAIPDVIEFAALSRNRFAVRALLADGRFPS